MLLIFSHQKNKTNLAEEAKKVQSIFDVFAFSGDTGWDTKARDTSISPSHIHKPKCNIRLKYNKTLTINSRQNSNYKILFKSAVKK